MSDEIAMSTDQRAAGRPIGFWATLGWTLLAFVAGLLAAAAVAAAHGRWVTGLTISETMLSGRGPIVGAMLILAAVVMAAVLVFAARRAGWSGLAYLALVRPRGRYVLAGILCVVVPLLLIFAQAQFDIRQIVPAEHFGLAQRANILHLQFYLLVLQVVIVMPVMEEIMFRGFAYRGLSETRIGVAGAILITSVVWAVIHLNKSPAAMFETAVHGIIWGWLRWYTGSLWVTIGAHVANNGFVILLSVAAMYGLFG